MRLGHSLQILLGIFIIVVTLLGTTVLALPPAPWEVEVIPPPPSPYPRKSVRSREVTVELINVSKVIVYVKSWCSECEEVTRYLTDRRVKFEKAYIFSTLTSLPGTILSSERPPVTVIDYTDGTRRRIVGFDEAIFDTLFGSYGAEKPNSFGLSEFDIRGSEKGNPTDSFDLR